MKEEENNNNITTTKAERLAAKKARKLARRALRKQEEEAKAKGLSTDTIGVNIEASKSVINKPLPEIPYNKTIPKSKNAELRAPKVKYFKPASKDNAFVRLKATNM